MCMSMQYYNSIPSTLHQTTNKISIHFFYREIVQFIWCNANGYFYENTKRNKYDRKKKIAFFTSKDSPVFGIFLFTLLERKKWKFICLKKSMAEIKRNEQYGTIIFEIKPKSGWVLRYLCWQPSADSASMIENSGGNSWTLEILFWWWETGSHSWFMIQIWINYIALKMNRSSIWP